MEVNTTESQVRKVIEAVDAQNSWRKLECINLIASENVMSPLATKLYISDFMHRYAEGDVGDRHYQGGKYVDEVEGLAIELVKSLFNTTFTDLRPLSGSMANLACFKALTEIGDLLFALSVPCGAHISHQTFGSAGMVGAKVKPYPFNEERMNIDVDATIRQVKKEKPNLLVFGGSVFLFPNPLKELREVADELDIRIMYDAAHVLGLIAAKKFQDPLREGADVVSSSTHKTFPGPQGGLIFTNNEELFERLKTAIFPGIVSNHHCHRIPALCITLLEMQKYGEEYANNIVRNAQKLAGSLVERGFKVVAESYGFTQSHQVVLDVSSLGGGGKVAKDLEKANIIVNKNLLPWDTVTSTENPSGVRIGVQEMTRFGMEDNEMDQIAEFMEKILIKRKNPYHIKKEVISFRKDFITPKFCFQNMKI
ncbi:MAG: serine hydroxymethyltransferase [Candidatus Hodarchaeota archaeon]